MKQLISLLLIFISSWCFSQKLTLSGVVKDAETNEFVPGATVRVGNNGTSTDASGKFALALEAGSFELLCAATGYETHKEGIRLAVGSLTELSILLNSADNLLEQVTVTSGRYEKPLGQVTVSLDILKPRLLKNTNTVSVDNVLSKIPGVSIIDGQASIRSGAGFSYGAGTRVLILVDDMPALQTDAGFPNWGDFPVENIAQIEVLKGAASALYGSSAMNGIINIRTGYTKDKPETEVAIFGKTWGNPRTEGAKWWGADTSFIQQPVETGASFVHRRKKGKWDLSMSGYSLYRDSYNKDTYSRYYRLSPNLRYRVNDRLNFGVNTNINWGRSGSFFIWAGDSARAYQPGLNSASFSAGRLRFTIDPTLNYYDRSGNRHKILSRYYYIKNNNSGNQSNFSRMYYGEYQIQRNMARLGIIATAGVVGTRTDINADLYNGKYKLQNYAGYAQIDYNGIKRLNLTAGLRHEQNQVNSPELVPRLNGQVDTIPGGQTTESKPVWRFGANYQFGKATYLRASWGQAYRYPTIAEKFINTSFSSFAGVGPNPDLVSETGMSAEIGIKQGLKIGSWYGYIDVAGFVQEYNQMMEFVFNGFYQTAPGKFQAVFQSENQGDTRVEGYEISLLGQGKLGPGQLFLLSGFTKTDPRYKLFSRENNFWGTSDTSVNVLKYRFRNTFKTDAEYEWNKFSAGLSIQYNSFMQAVDLLFQEALPGVKKFRTENNHGFTVVDLRFAWNFTKQFRVSAICNNLLNQEYSYRPAIMEGPRNLTIRLEWKW